jgi:hypothetical protein
MREKLFTLTRYRRVAMWQRFKQTDARRDASPGIRRRSAYRERFKRCRGRGGCVGLPTQLATD